MKNYYIQAQDTSGNWRTYHVTQARSEEHTSELQSH